MLTLGNREPWWLSSGLDGTTRGSGLKTQNAVNRKLHGSEHRSVNTHSPQAVGVAATYADKVDEGESTSEDFRSPLHSPWLAVTCHAVSTWEPARQVVVLESGKA